MNVVTDPKKIKGALTRGVKNIYPSCEALEKVLLSGKKLRIYNGIDPTGKLHIGHGIVLRKLRQFQDLGHEIIVLIGDFTAQIGDPTGKLSTRRPLTKEQIEKNTEGYKKLIGKILDLKSSNVRFLHNEEWTNKLKPVDMLEIASHFTVSQLIERDMFQQRIKGGKEIYVHEFLYPVFQAYDSVTMDVDMEIGGTDQTFNMLAGRTLMKKMRQKEKFILTMKLLTDPEGRKMGKTEGNMVEMDEQPKEMFGRIMSWPDELILTGFELLTDVADDEIKNLRRNLKKHSVNPRNAKARLAKAIITFYHGKVAAEKAAEEFDRVFKQKELPAEMPTLAVPKKDTPILDLLVKTKLASSKAEAQRLVNQDGIKIDGRVESDWKAKIVPKSGMVLQAGKRRFVRII